MSLLPLKQFLFNALRHRLLNQTQHERHWARIVCCLSFITCNKRQAYTFPLSRLYEVHFMKHVIQASTASSHRVGKCIFEPSKQSRIRKSSFWSHRRSTVQWETALSSKERSRRVNCPMTVPYNVCLIAFRLIAGRLLPYNDTIESLQLNTLFTQ